MKTFILFLVLYFFMFVAIEAGVNDVAIEASTNDVSIEASTNDVSIEASTNDVSIEASTNDVASTLSCPVKCGGCICCPGTVGYYCGQELGCSNYRALYYCASNNYGPAEYRKTCNTCYCPSGANSFCG
jgi:hypothetical protein